MQMFGENMSWLDLVGNKEQVAYVYGQETPSLSGVSLHEINLSDEATSMRIRFDLATFPDHPPSEWSRGWANTIQMEFLMKEIDAITISDWATTMRVDMTISQSTDGTFELSCKPTPTVHVTARSIRVSKISAYRDSSREALA